RTGACAGAGREHLRQPLHHRRGGGCAAIWRRRIIGYWPQGGRTLLFEPLRGRTRHKREHRRPVRRSGPAQFLNDQVPGFTAVKRIMDCADGSVGSSAFPAGAPFDCRMNEAMSATVWGDSVPGLSIGMVVWMRCTRSPAVWPSKSTIRWLPERAGISSMPSSDEPWQREQLLI